MPPPPAFASTASTSSRTTPGRNGRAGA
jgi:hypothetical protein